MMKLNIEIDLTSKQFKKGTKFVKQKILSRKEVIKNDKRVLETYEILKKIIIKIFQSKTLTNSF